MASWEGSRGNRWRYWIVNSDSSDLLYLGMCSDKIYRWNGAGCGRALGALFR